MAVTHPVEIEQVTAAWRFRGQRDLHRVVRAMRHRGHSLRHCLHIIVAANDDLELTPFRTSDLMAEDAERRRKAGEPPYDPRQGKADDE